METNYKKGNTTLWIALLIMAVFFICCSCGSRKVEKTVVKTQESEVTTHNKIDTTKSTSSIDRNILVVDSSASEEFTITPIDSSKEMVVSGKTYFNALIRHKKVKNNIVVENKENVKTTQEKGVSESTITVKEKQISVEEKKTDRKIGFPWWILIVVLVAYVIYRKYKRLPLLPF